MFSPTYVLSYFLTVGIVFFSELLITCIHCKFLAGKQYSECFENHRGCIIVLDDKVEGRVSISINIRQAATKI